MFVFSGKLKTHNVRPEWPPGIELKSAAHSPVGAVKSHGLIVDSRGLGQGKGRRLGRYALVYSLAGACNYWDELNGRRTIRAGEAFFVFPEIAHRYGGSGGNPWDELFIVFEGPVFDVWRERGLLDPRRPFLRLEPVPIWRRRIEDGLETGGRVGRAAALWQVVALQALIADALDAQTSGAHSPPAWIGAACDALSKPGAQTLRLPALARSLGVSFETFRKRFTATMGISPARWRSARMVDAAARLLAGTQLTGKEIAERLGFSDEFHFSRRIRELSGMTPTEFRRRAGAPAVERHRA